MGRHVLSVQLLKSNRGDCPTQEGTLEPQSHWVRHRLLKHTHEGESTQHNGVYEPGIERDRGPVSQAGGAAACGLDPVGAEALTQRLQHYCFQRHEFVSLLVECLKYINK